KLRGEAFYLDLGPGARPLIALLTSSLHPKYGEDVRWSRDGGPVLFRLFGIPLSPDAMDGIAKLARIRGAHQIRPADLPDLVTFADVSDPKSVIEVDPKNLQATLGPGISWNEITLECTDEPITKGIERKLTWIDAYSSKMLDGSPYHDKNTLAN